MIFPFCMMVWKAAPIEPVRNLLRVVITYIIEALYDKSLIVTIKNVLKTS